MEYDMLTSWLLIALSSTSLLYWWRLTQARKALTKTRKRLTTAEAEAQNAREAVGEVVAAAQRVSCDLAEIVYAYGEDLGEPDRELVGARWLYRPRGMPENWDIARGSVRGVPGYIVRPRGN